MARLNNFAYFGQVKPLIYARVGIKPFSKSEASRRARGYRRRGGKARLIKSGNKYYAFHRGGSG